MMRAELPAAVINNAVSLRVLWFKMPESREMQTNQIPR